MAGTVDPSRILIVPQNLVTPPLMFPPATPGGNLEYGFDCTALIVHTMAADITQFSLNCAPAAALGELGLTDWGCTGNIAAFRAGGGQSGRVYLLHFTITFTDGRTMAMNARLQFGRDQSPWPAVPTATPGFGTAHVWTPATVFPP